MSNESFSVGEIAIFAPAYPGRIGKRIGFGAEVEIIGPLRPCELIGGVAYEIRSSEGVEVLATPGALRKRRPPQDWKTLCHLTDLPREVPEHV